MVKKFFLALDYKTGQEACIKGIDAINFLKERYGNDFIKKKLGVKINEDLITCGLYDNQEFTYKDFKDELGCDIFVDKKISHGYDTGKRIINRVQSEIPLGYVTVSAALGTGILKKYVEYGESVDVKIIAFTAHTKTSHEDAEKIFKQPLPDAMLNLAEIASDAGCDAVVMEANMLSEEKIRELPIKKLVTGIRIDPSDKGTQKRVSTVEELKALKEHVAYAVVSSRYLSNFDKLSEVVEALK